MSDPHWWQQVVQEQIALHEREISQFHLTPLGQPSLATFSEHKEAVEHLQSLGIWALQQPQALLQALKHGDAFTVVVGFKPSRFHLGHLTLAREIAWYMGHGALPVFVLSGHEAGIPLSQGQAREKVAEFWEIVRVISRRAWPFPEDVYSDADSALIRTIEFEIGAHLSVGKILSLYGWEKTITVNRLRVAATLAAAFLLAQKLRPDWHTVVPIDIHQAPHAEITRQVAMKVGYSVPTFSYRVLLPSLRTSQERMSIKNPKTALFLSESVEELDKKLQKAVTSGLPLEAQRQIGGKPHCCAFFRAAQAALDEEAEAIATTCRSGNSTCRECKAQNSKNIIDAITHVSRSIAMVKEPAEISASHLSSSPP